MSSHQGQLLRKLRKENGVTQADLAEALNLHDQYIGSFENNRKTPAHAVAAIRAWMKGKQRTLCGDCWLETGNPACQCDETKQTGE